MTEARSLDRFPLHLGLGAKAVQGSVVLFSDRPGDERNIA